jgi:hypothetical protein
MCDPQVGRLLFPNGAFGTRVGTNPFPRFHCYPAFNKRKNRRAALRESATYLQAASRILEFRANLRLTRL